MATNQFGTLSLEVDADGHLARRTDWNQDLAAIIAKEEGIDTLADRHWAVINYMRKEFDAHGDAPSICKLTKESGVDTKELYALFPNLGKWPAGNSRTKLMTSKP